jgi:integrase
VETSTAGQAAKALVYLKSALTWASGLEVRPAGLADPWWTRVKVQSPGPVRTQNTLFVEEIGRLLAIAELNRVVPGRSIVKETAETTLCMLWWLVVTAQRSSASSLVLRRHVTPYRQTRWAGWGVVSYPAENMKSRRFHALPLPPLAMAVVARAHEAAKAIGRQESHWLFPSVRTKSKTRVSSDLGAEERCVGQLLRRLRGQDPKGLAVHAPNLLADLPYFTPHNIRHSFATRFGETAAVGGAVSAVFDHAVDIPEGREFRRSGMLDVYDKSHRLPLKAQVLSPWCYSVHLHYEKALEEMMAQDPRHAAAKPWRFTLETGVFHKPWQKDDDGFSEVE